jgi:hypothetical protein
MQALRAYLLEHVRRDSHRYFGRDDGDFIEFVVDAWLNDASNSAHRYEDMYRFFGKAKVGNERILDMASGCGTFVFYGLLNGLDVWGIEPEDWKNRFNHMKADTYGYPEAWKGHLVKAVGEHLPFRDGAFGFVSSYQTLEHVQDVQQCLAEMIRVARVAVFLRAPDYSGTFEGHYCLPWLPLFPRRLARLYLHLLGRPTLGLDTIQYITTHRIKRILRQYPVKVYDQQRLELTAQKVAHRLKLDRWGILRIPLSWMVACVWRLIGTARRLFRKEESTNLVILKESLWTSSDRL